jgi:hypothetical protein
MRKLGREPFDSDICLFKHEKHGALLILYVDDLLIATPTVKDIYEIQNAIGKFFTEEYETGQTILRLRDCPGS